jgi:hypothetical protein
MMKVYRLGEDGKPQLDETTGQPLFDEVPANTGVLVVRKHQGDGTVDVVPTHNVPAHLHEMSSNCCYYETQVCNDEMRRAYESQQGLRPLNDEEARWLAEAQLAAQDQTVWLVDFGRLHERGPP